MALKSGKLIICRGIPASGKSTWAKAQENAIVVTRDDIRLEYGCIGGGWSKEKEVQFVIPEMNKRIRDGLKEGKTVICADTNIPPKHVARLMGMAKQYDAEYFLKEFFTPLDICLERDSKREHPVGEDNIRRYHKQLNEYGSLQLVCPAAD